MIVRQLALSALVLLGGVASSVFGADRIVTLTGDPWPPYVVGQVGNDATSGIGLELIQEVFERVDGASVRFPLLPWKRALIAAQEGTMDGIGILLKTMEREQYLLFTDPLFSSYDLAWYSARKFPTGIAWNTIDDLVSYTIGVVAGFSYSKEIDLAIRNKTLSVVNSPNARQLFSMLVGGRIDIAFANKSVGCSLAQQYIDDDRILSMEKEVTVSTYYLGISRKSSAIEFVPKMNSAISEMRNEGVIDQTLYSKKSDCGF